jgi:hypothetical protein
MNKPMNNVYTSSCGNLMYRDYETNNLEKHPVLSTKIHITVYIYPSYP